MEKHLKFLTVGICCLSLSWMLGCGSTDTEQSAAPISENDSSSAQTEISSFPEELGSLSIVVEDTWVRDQPTLEGSEVVFTLPLGTECKILELGPYDIIKGFPDQWYRIQSGEKEGFVFGTGTNLRKNKQLFGSGERQERWAGVVKGLLNERIKPFCGGEDAVPDELCVDTLCADYVDQTGAFSILWGANYPGANGEDLEMDAFEPFESEDDPFLRYTHWYLSAGGHSNYTYYQLSEKADYAIVELEGWPDRVFRLTATEDLIITFSRVGGGGYGGFDQGRVNCYLVNERTREAKKLRSELAFESGIGRFSMLLEEGERFLYSDSLTLAYAETGESIEIEIRAHLIERREKGPEKRLDSYRVHPVRYDFNTGQVDADLWDFPLVWTKVESSDSGYIYVEHCYYGSHFIRLDGQNFQLGDESEGMSGKLESYSKMPDGSLLFDFKGDEGKFSARFNWVDQVNGLGKWTFEQDPIGWGFESGVFVAMSKLDLLEKVVETCPD